MKCLIFDLNGVFIVSPYLSDRFVSEFGVNREEFLVALKDVLYHARRSKTAISFEHWQPYLNKWGLDLTAEQFFDFWFKAERANPDMVALAKDMKVKGFKIFVLSNNFVERAEYYTQTFTGMLKIFDGVYYSFESGFVKPDRRAYENLLTENNLSAKDCFYFDNSRENVEVAKELGMKAFLFESAEETRKIIESK